MHARTLTLAIAALATAIPATAATPALGHDTADEGRIVFSTQPLEGGFADVFVARPDGTHAQQVPLEIPLDGFGGGFWAPNGRRLLITNLYQLPEPFRPATVKPDGSAFTVLNVPTTSFDMYCNAWSPTGTRILCNFGGDQDEPQGVFSIRARDGGDPVRLTTNPFGGLDIPGGYSPDGSRIVFVRQKPGPGPDPDAGMQGALFVANADGSRPRQITEFGLAQPWDPALARWSPDGRRILFGSQDGHLFTVRPNGTGLTEIHLPTGDQLTWAYSPGWSPHGSRIIFPMWRSGSGQADLYTARPDGSDLTQITDSPEIENFADWTATGH